MFQTVTILHLNISQGGVVKRLSVVKYLTMTFLQIACWVCQWKNFKNWSTIGKFTNKSL